MGLSASRRPVLRCGRRFMSFLLGPRPSRSKLVRAKFSSHRFAQLYYGTIATAKQLPEWLHSYFPLSLVTELGSLPLILQSGLTLYCVEVSTLVHCLYRESSRRCSVGRGSVLSIVAHAHTRPRWLIWKISHDVAQRPSPFSVRSGESDASS